MPTNINKSKKHKRCRCHRRCQKNRKPDNICANHSCDNKIYKFDQFSCCNRFECICDGLIGPSGPQGPPGPPGPPGPSGSSGPSTGPEGSP